MSENEIISGNLEESAQKWIADITSIERDYFAEVQIARIELDQAEDNLNAAKKAERDAFNAFIDRMEFINEQYRARCLQAAKPQQQQLTLEERIEELERLINRQPVFDCAVPF